MRFIASIFFSLAALPAAGEFSLDLPVDCILGESCRLQQFVDHDPSAGSADFQCGDLSYDAHKGTDIALPSLIAQRAGVNVLAAADGVVLGLRDDMVDILQSAPNAPDVAGRECGNGLVLHHEDGWQTQYCHMALGSLQVVTGQRVAAGQVLGQIGLSGATEFPHLHLSVRHEGSVIDPFAPNGTKVCEQSGNDTLWNTDLATPAGGVIDIGFSQIVPSFAQIKEGAAGTENLSRNDPIVLWGIFFGMKAGDRVNIEVIGPNGELFSDEFNIDRSQAQSFQASGRRAPASGWEQGRYHGTITIKRGSSVLDQSNREIYVE